MGFYACVIVNPASANGATGRRWPEIRAALDRVLDRWDAKLTRAPGDATRLAREAIAEGYEMLVSIGGDGTMSEVVTGLFRPSDEGIAPELLRPDVVLAPVRQGTGGDFARHLGLTGKLPASVQHLAGDATRPVDVGVVELHDREGRLRRSAFLNIGSFGLAGLVDEKVNGSTKMLGGTASFLMGLGRALAAYRPQSVRVTCDGAPFYEGAMVNCAVANGQYFGGGMRIASKADPGDGLFDVVVQTRSGPREILAIGDLYSGKVADWATVRYTQGRSVRAEASDPEARVLLDIDGEQLGTLPATFTLVPGAARLKVA